MASALVALGACGTEDAAAPSAEDVGTVVPTSLLEEPGPEPSPDTGSEDLYDWVPPPNLNAFVHWSDAAITAKVLSVGPARWNSADGKQWTDRPPIERRADHMPPTKYRDATVTVQQVVYDSDRIHVVPGTNMVVRVWGDCSATGDPVEGQGLPPGVRTNDIVGPIEEGSEVLAQLYLMPWWIEGVGVRPTATIRSFWGLWQIAGQTATNRQPFRFAPVGTLVARMREERGRPFNPSGNRGKFDPVE